MLSKVTLALLLAYDFEALKALIITALFSQFIHLIAH